MLLCTFSTGEKKLFDVMSLSGPAFEPLKDEAIFNNLTVEHGFISWNKGSIDIAPEYLYKNSIPYEETDILRIA